MSDSSRPLEFLKLISGEQILGRIEPTSNEIFRIYDPLSFETGAADDNDPSRRFVYMSRFVPFMAEQVVDIERKKVIFHGAPSKSISRYYEASLAFCQRHTDTDFESCLTETSEQMEQMVSQIDMENAIVNAPVSNTTDSKVATQEILQNIFLAAMPTANSVH